MPEPGETAAAVRAMSEAAEAGRSAGRHAAEADGAAVSIDPPLAG